MSLNKGELILVLGLPDETYGHKFLGRGVVFRTLAQCSTADAVPYGVALIAYYVPTVNALGDKMMVGQIQSIALIKRLPAPDPIHSIQELEKYVDQHSPERTPTQEDLELQKLECDEYVTSQIPEGVDFSVSRAVREIVARAKRIGHDPIPSEVEAEVRRVRSQRLQKIAEQRAEEQKQAIPAVPEVQPVVQVVQEEVKTPEPVKSVQPWSEFLDLMLPAGTEFIPHKELKRVVKAARIAGHHLSEREIFKDITLFLENRQLRALRLQEELDKVRKDQVARGENVVDISSHQKPVASAEPEAQSTLTGFDVSNLSKEQKLQLVVQLWSDLFGGFDARIKNLEDKVFPQSSKIV